MRRASTSAAEALFMHRSKSRYLRHDAQQAPREVRQTTRVEQKKAD